MTALVILVCAHSPVLHRFFETALEERADVVEAGTFEDAVKRLEYTKVDLVIFDEKNAGKSVEEAIVALRGKNFTPVLVITGSLKKSYYKKLLAAGAADVLREPFEKEDLLEKVETALQKTSVKGKVRGLAGRIGSPSVEGLGRKVEIGGKGPTLTKELLSGMESVGIIVIKLDEYMDNEGKWSLVDEFIPQECNAVIPLEKNMRMLLFKNSSRSRMIECADTIREKTGFAVGYAYQLKEARETMAQCVNKVLARAKENCK